MARLAGIDLPRNKRIDVALTYIHGIGQTSARKICEKAEITPDSKTDVLADAELVRLREIIERLEFMIDVGLGYLSLDRPTGTLSGGESQRIRLATQIGAGLSGVLYVLDEPSIGLHPRDNHRLLESLRKLTEAGNSVIVHSTISLAHNLDMTVVAEGVETEAAWEALKILGCDYCQGYHFSRPLVAEDLLGFVRAQGSFSPIDLPLEQPDATVPVAPIPALSC